MARLTLSVLLGFVLPVALLLVNLIWGFGGLLAFILLLIWLGLAVVLLIPEDQATA